MVDIGYVPFNLLVSPPYPGNLCSNVYIYQEYNQCGKKAHSPMGPHNVAESSLLQTRFEIRFNMTAFHSGGGKKKWETRGRGVRWVTRVVGC